MRKNREFSLRTALSFVQTSKKGIADRDPLRGLLFSLFLLFFIAGNDPADRNTDQRHDSVYGEEMIEE